MKNFWQDIANKNKPFFCLAPMEDVTDIAFREMFVRYSKQKKCRGTQETTFLTRGSGRLGIEGLKSLFPEFLSLKYKLFPAVFSNNLNNNLVMFTEFTPSDGLAFGDASAQAKLRAKLSYTEGQRPIVAQIYNSNPKRMEDAARLVQELGFDGVDINMGCPVNAVVKQVSGAALIKHPELAIQLMRAVRRGAPNIPLSVKTRIGYSSVSEMNDWIKTLLQEQPDALTVHLRTRSQMSKTPANWSLMPEVIKLRDKISPKTIIIGNGDVQSVEHGKELAQEYGCDGIMVGRATFGTPDFFVSAKNKAQQTNFLNPLSLAAHCPGFKKLFPELFSPVSIQEIKEHKIKMLIEHLELFDKWLLKPKYKGYHVMKKHFKAYINGWKGAKKLREQLMATNSTEEAIKLLQNYK